MQEGITTDELRLVFTEQGLADALTEAIVAIDGREDAREHANELATIMFAAAIITKRELGPESP